jgi:release factor glutamine methyltransferase
VPIYAQLLHSSERRLRGVGIDTARLDAEMLLALAAGLGRTGLYGQLHISASSDVETHFAALLDRRARREPIAYITGVQEFWSLSFAVTPAVLVPRPETELLVELARRSVGPDQVGSGAESDGRWICDVGTGSGCIAVALAQELPDARVVAVDVSTAALAVAARNAAEHGVADRVYCVESDLFDGLDPATRFDVIVSNPPYLRPEDFLSPELAFEPRAALAGGPDGLDVIRYLVAAAPARLRAGGRLIMEFGCGQDAAVSTLARAAGLTDVQIAPDLAGIPRALVARGSATVSDL